MAKWQNHPFSLKPLRRPIYTLGTNRFVFHRYSMQPWLDRKPGMTFGPFGLHYERTNTWWEQSRAWHTYLARCQALLQRGQFVADVACLGSEGSPQIFPKRDSANSEPICRVITHDVPAEVILNQTTTVRDGRVVLASGMSYQVLVLPPGRTMTPALVTKIKDLVTAGATVLGPRPTQSPSLNDYPNCDTEVQHIAAEVWGACDGEASPKTLTAKAKWCGEAPGGCSSRTGYAAGLRL